jgi:hypothetical protein
MSNKDLIKIKQTIHNFLDAHRTTENEYTHLSYGSFNGKFNLNKEAQKEFIKLYIHSIKNGVNDLSILEKQSEYSRVIVDVDLIKPDVNNNNNNNNNRLYNNDLIKKICKYYIKSIKKYLNVSNENLFIHVFEKDEPTKKDNKFKDGFHLVFPNIIANTSIRTKIFNNVLKYCNNSFMFF